MSLLNLILPHIKKFKFFVMLALVFAITYVCSKRWQSSLPPWYINCAVTVGVTLVGILIYLTLKKRHEKKMAAALEAGISSADEDKVDLKGEIKALRENWQTSLGKLKASRMGADSKAILFKLPWYIIIGEPASGKSTLLRKSGLDFPVGDAEVAGLHGTRNCDWWFANEAIFLDTAGRYIIESQEQEWTAFLDLLKKYRTKKPINGVMVALPANSLLTKNHDELLVDGKRIRQRIDELIEGLGINFPIYVLITKCDLVSGFVEFFGNLDRRHAEQMLGWTNPQDANARFDGEALDQHFKEVSTRLFQMRPWLESKAKKRDLMKAFLYPEEFSYLNQPLRTVLDVVFKPNVYQETPVCRGVYFSSGTQVGGPLALALEDMARDLGISSDFGFGLTMEEEKELRTYFIKDLVSEQILKDQEMNWRTWSAEAKLKKRRMGWGLVGVAISLFLALFATKSFIQNQGRLSDFKVSIPEGARPLEAAVGCLKTRKDAVRPGFMDVGLNYSDELIPSMDRAFRSVFARGCLSPLLEDLAKPLQAGIQDDENGRPDVPGYLELWRRYVYLRDGPSDQRENTAELEALFGMLRERGGTGRGTSDDLRNAMKEYGGLKSDVQFDRRQREVESAFVRSLTPIVEKSEKWASGRLEKGQGLEEAFADAIDNLKKDCNRYKSKVTSHDSEGDIARIAKEIRKSAKVKTRGGSSGLNLENFAGVTESTDLVKLLKTVKDAYPAQSEIAPEDVPNGGHLPQRIEAVSEKLAQPLAQESLRDKEAARTAIIKFLDGVIEGDDETYAYDSPTRESLLDRQVEIEDELVEAQAEAWEKVKGAVAELEGAPVETEDDEGNPVSAEGWWETLPLLARARLTDLRKVEYLKDGLTPYLADNRWQRERSTDRDEEVYTRTQLKERILPAVREQVEFFKDEYTATRLAEDALRAGTEGVTGYLEDLSAYWTGRFESGLPDSVGKTLPEIYDQLGEWSDKKSDLRTACAAIDEALYGLTDIQAEDGDPLLEATDRARQEIFDTFVVCFSPDRKGVSTHTTVIEASGPLGELARQLEPVAGRRFGGVGSAAARNLVGQVLTGTGRSPVLAQALEVVKDLRDESGSEPAKRLADWLDQLLLNAWNGLVMETEKDINERWSVLASQWRSRLADGDTVEFKRIFDERNSEFAEFEKEYIKPFFREPNYAAIQGHGATLHFGGGIRTFLGNLRSLGDSLFTSSGGIRSDKMLVGLRVSGGAPAALKLHYQSEEGEDHSDERRMDNPVTFPFEWTPTTCVSFSMEVFFRDGTSKILPREFRDKWAVAEALASADQVSGNTFIWRGEEQQYGDWQIELTFKGGGPGELYKLYQKTNGQDPVKWILASLPDSVVEVR